MSTVEPSGSDYILVYVGYTMGALNIIKCVIALTLDYVLSDKHQQKEDKKYSDSNSPTSLDLNNDTTGFKCVCFVSCGGACLELIFAIVLIIGIYLEKPWMLMPWIVFAVINVLVDLFNFIRSAMKPKSRSEIPRIVFSILAIVLSIASLVIMIKLYKWLRIKKK